MKKFVILSIFIIFIFNCANISNLFSQDSDGMDFLDQLLKEIETMEKSPDESKATKYEDITSGPVKSEPLPRYSEISSETEDTPALPEAKISSKDIRTLFLDPDVQQVKGSGKTTKTRPTKESVNALNFYSDEFNITAHSVENKITINPNLPPQFKDTKFTEFKNELELTNSLMEIIKDKGIYRSLFLKPEKDTGSEKRQTSKETAKPSNLVRKEFLNLLKELQNLDEELGQPEEEKEAGIDVLKQLAGQEPKKIIPKYKPLSIKKKTPEKVESTQENDDSEE